MSEHGASSTDEAGLPPLVCQVCGGGSGEEALGVAGSTLGPVSFAYCRPCLEQGAEPCRPLRLLVLWDCGGLEGCAEWVRYLTTWHEGRYIGIADLPPLTEEEVAEMEAIDRWFASPEMDYE